MKFFNVLDPDVVKEKIYNLLSLPKSEIVSLYDAIGRRAVKPLKSPENLPEYNRSTVDGYAVSAQETYGATDSVPCILKVLGSAKMGEINQFELHRGESVYVPTGGEVPKGADAVCMVEYTDPMQNEVAIYRPVSVSENIISVGEDVEYGQEILSVGELITPLKAGVLASLGFSQIEVYKKWKVAVISTGDEIVGIDEKRNIGQIRDVNTLINCVFSQNDNCDIVYKDRVLDGFELLENAVTNALKVADIILVSGGSSIGQRDFTERVFEKYGEIVVHGVAIKPGKPTIVSKTKNNKIMVGLPGHPMACLLTLKLLVLSTLNKKLGGEECEPYIYANTTMNFPSSPGRLTVQPVSLSYNKDGTYATPVFYKSGYVSALDKADGYMLIPTNVEGIKIGQRIKVYLLK